MMDLKVNAAPGNMLTPSTVGSFSLTKNPTWEDSLQVQTKEPMRINRVKSQNKRPEYCLRFQFNSQIDRLFSKWLTCTLAYRLSGLQAYRLTTFRVYRLTGSDSLRASQAYRIMGFQAFFNYTFAGLQPYRCTTLQLLSLTGSQGLQPYSLALQPYRHTCLQSYRLTGFAALQP